MAEIFCLSGALSGLLTARAPSASAQSGAPTGTAATELQPPELLERVQAEYPEEARRSGLEASVGLRLTIDVRGQVVEAAVTEAAGHGFDEAAQEATLRFRFAPALRGTRPVQARLHFVYEFKLPLASAAPDPEPLTEPAPSAPAVPEPVPAEVTAESPSSQPAPVAVDVQVRGKLTEGERLQQSAEAVTVVDTKKAKQQTADMGEVLARTQGVSVRRYGGLGSTARISMNGLYDDQIRLFLPAVPGRHPARFGRISFWHRERARQFGGPDRGVPRRGPGAFWR